MKEVRHQIVSRLYLVLVGLGLLPVLVGVQLVRLNLAERDLAEVGLRQARSMQVLPAVRGSILDRSGRRLAVNTARYELALDPTAPGFDAQAASFFEQLSKLTGKSARGYRTRVQKRYSPQYVRLERSISEAQKEKVVAMDVPGVILTPQFARRYNYATTASHLVGHVDVDLNGLAGIEKEYNQYMRGEMGRRVVKRDRRGYIKALVGGSEIEPKHGQDVVLTVDLVRQAILEEELARGVEESGATWGTAIAMDPYTGAILAMGNVPTYDPNQPARFADAERRNHAITDHIEPGSTFKLVTAAALIDQGIVEPGDTVDTGAGWAMFSRRTMHDTHAHGRIPFSEVIAKSSNIGTARTAMRLKPGVLYQYARSLGFGQSTWIDLPGEVPGTLKKPSTWSRISQAWISHGYEVEATPLQLLTAYAALANGGLLVQPYVVSERRDVFGRTVWHAAPDSVRRVFDPETARKLLPMFEAVVESGTAKQAQIEGLRIAGKTGTAQKATNGGYGREYRASFVGFFPADQPEVVLIVILDEPQTSGYGGVVSAPIFKRIAERWIGTFPRIAARMAPPDTLPVIAEWPVPDVIQMPVNIATAQLMAHGFDVLTERSDLSPFRPVANQRPRAGRHRDRVVTLALPDPKIPDVDLMPDLTGFGSRQAVAWLAARGVKVQVKGSGRVVSQLPAAGQPTPGTAVLTCE